MSTPAAALTSAHSSMIFSRQSFARRFLAPVAISVTICVLIYILNSDKIQIENLRFYRAYKNLMLLFLYLSIWFSGALLVYPLAFFRGASLPERILAAYITPVGYILSEMVRVSEYFPVGEAIYYGLSTMGLLTLSLQVGLLAISEMVCRKVNRSKRGQTARVVTLWPVISLVFMIIMVYILFLWGMGVHWFFIYQEGYRLLFYR